MPTQDITIRAPKFPFTVIPTKYRGRFYRSRLEARWAVFFDVLNLKFEYELEGVELADGTRYLPDFYLPQVKWWVEIKPTVSAFGKQQKPYLFTKYTAQPILMLHGSPAFTSYSGLQLVDGEAEPLEFSLDIHAFDRAFREGYLWADPNYQAMASRPDEPEECFSLRYRAAVEAAGMARFER